MFVISFIFLYLIANCSFFLACERGWYGPGCIHRCDCHNGATCDARTGICLCGMGVTGRLCDQGLYY